MEFRDYHRFAERLLQTVQRAGRAEMAIYRQGFTVETKSDSSPVTAADRAAEAIILADLEALAPAIPVIAEEAASEGIIPAIGERFFLVDPLDGTKEFVRNSNEFTVNIALVERGVPVFGIVFAPALARACVTLGASEAVSLPLDPDGPDAVLNELPLTRLQTSAPKDDGLSVVASKSHMTEITRTYLQQYKLSSLCSAGSSLKFCLLAAGEADLYPRFGPTMEWDTAAGHAILAAAGGTVVTEQKEPLTYGKTGDHFRNPFFIAWAWPDKMAASL